MGKEVARFGRKTRYGSKVLKSSFKATNVIQ
jgi:hypothetical protein